MSKLTVRVTLFKKPSKPVSGDVEAVLVVTRNRYLAYSQGIFVVMDIRQNVVSEFAFTLLKQRLRGYLVT